MAFLIKHDREACIGCGNCAAICPENWMMRPDNKSKPIKIKVDKPGCNREAEKGCPVKCIKVVLAK